jgi:hypothetical protein
MRVKCIKADDTNILIEDAIYTVSALTNKGNYTLFEANPPEGFNCFDKNRFEIIETLEEDRFDELGYVDELGYEFGWDQEEIDIIFS